MEVELKLLVDAQYMAALLSHPLFASHAAAPPHAYAQSDTYFDTPKLRLHGHDAGLRVRRIGQVFVQTLKSGGRANVGLYRRHEWESKVPGPQPDLTRLRRVVDDKRTCRAVLRSPSVKRRLAAIFDTEVRRTVWDLRLEGGDVVACALDEGRLQCGDKSMPINELELELKSGDAAHLYAFALALHDSIPLHIANQSKAERGYALLAQDRPRAVKAAPLTLTPDMTVEQAFQTIVANCLAHIQANETLVAGSDDVEGLHQMRVGLRRLRSALSLFKSLIPLPDALQQEFDWLSTQLTAGRDWDVLAGSTIDDVAAQTPDAPHIDALKNAADHYARCKHREASEAVDSARYTALLLRFGGWMQGKTWRNGSAHEGWQQGRQEGRQEARHEGGHDGEDRATRDALAAPVSAFAHAILRKDQHRLHTRGKNLRNATPEARHRVRIAAKKTRYAAEFFQSLLAPRQLRPYVKTLTRLQDELGYLNDAAVAERLLDELVTEQAELVDSANFVKGVLAARVEHDDKKIRQLWNKFAAMKLPQ